MQTGVKTTEFPQQIQASETDTLLGNIGQKSSQISFADVIQNVSFSAFETAEKTIAGAMNALQNLLADAVTWKLLKAVDVTAADGNVTVDYSGLSPQPKEFCVRYGRENGSNNYGGGAVTTPNQGGDPFFLPIYINNNQYIGNAYIFVNAGAKNILLQFSDTTNVARTAKFKIFYR